VSAVPRRSCHFKDRPQQSVEIARFREREEALEVNERRLLLREERRVVRQQLTLNHINIGHRRFALIQKMGLSTMAVVSGLLALIGAVGLAAAVLAGIVLGTVGVTALQDHRS
jgi:hypothetical protein